MIRIGPDSLTFSFTDIHPSAVLTVDFQRTLRIPDDGRAYHLPPGLGQFPLARVEQYASTVPASWAERGGAMLPMYQSEALWISFHGEGNYRFAVKVTTGSVNAVSGTISRAGLNRDAQDYVVVPEQPWLDGYCVERGVIRQFVAMPLGAGYTAEEQLTGKAEHGGLKIEVFPMKRAVYDRRFPPGSARGRNTGAYMVCESAAPMGLAPGGRMEQDIYEDPYDLGDWDIERGQRCFVHIANSMVWREITGSNPPTVPFTAKEYQRAGLPWFALLDEGKTAVSGAAPLARMKSVVEMGGVSAAGNQSVDDGKVIQLPLLQH